MRHYRFSILFTLILFIVPDTKAQESLNYFFRHLNQSDGLLHNEVFSIVQDGKGFIWIANSNGLQRYDGSRFIDYPEMLSNPDEGLAYGIEMYADKKNNLLWFTHGTNIKKMELNRNQFSVYDNKKLLKESSLSLTTYRGPDNQVWNLGLNTLSCYDSTTNKSILSFLTVLPPNAHRTSYIATDTISNMTWVGGLSELYLFDKKNKTVYSQNYNPSNHPLLQLSFYGTTERSSRLVMIDSRQNIWITTWGDKLYKYNEATKKIKVYSLSAIKTKQEGRKVSAASPLINCILEDDNHTIWIGTENAGLLRYNNEKDNFDYCITQERDAESIWYDYKIFSLFQDKEQNIWVGTDKGINIFNPYRQYFRYLRHEKNNPLSISKSEITSFIQAPNGDMFIGTWGGGLAIYDSKFVFKKNILFNGPADKNFIWSFLQADNNTIWIGCQFGWLLVYNITTGVAQSMHPAELQGSTIRCMEKDDKGNVWFGLHNGKISKWDRRQEKFFSYSAGPLDNLTRADAVTNIFIDRSQQCWVSTEAGFKQFNLEKRTYDFTWVSDKNNVNSLSGKACRGIEEYNDSILLIGTIYGGLNFFNKRTKTFSHLTIADGLPSNNIYAIKKGTGDNIWFTTDYGLYKFDPAQKKTISYSMDRGVISSSFIAGRFYTLQDGQWLTFTIAEAVRFFPHKVEHQDNRRPKIEITGFKLFDKPVSIDSLLFENKPVRLSYKENFFTVEFAALNFSNLYQTNYYHRLSGVDQDWVHGGTNRFANYTDLQPGEYTFAVKAENGNSSGNSTSFKIIIAPPFWKTWWFISIILLCIFFLIYLLVKWREKNIKAMYRMNEQLSKAKLEALRSQMNPHFIFNCINSIDGLIQSNDKYHATVYLNKFAKLIRNILDSSKQNTVTLSKDLDTLKLYIELEQLRHENKFTAEIKADDVLLQDDYKVPPLIIQPFVENAILHGIRYRTDNNGKLSVLVFKQDDYLQYIIEDNGVGRNTFNSLLQKEKISYGIDMSNDRVKLFNNEEKASVQIIDLFEKGSPVGTKVEVLLKIQ